MRAHGTRACYVHGPEPGSRPGGCRCEPCRTAAREAQREARSNPVPSYVTAGPARQHVEFLATHGVGLKQIAKTSGVAHGTLWKLVYGVPGRGPSQRIRPSTSEKILAVTPADVADGGKVPAGPTWAKIDELVAAGVPKAEIGRRIGQQGGGLHLSRHQVSGRHARSIAAMHAEYLAGTFTFVRRSRHGDRTVTLEPPERHDDTPDQVRRANETARRARYRTGEAVMAMIDDADLLMVELAEILENRIDHADWRAHAACRGLDAWMFFPDQGDRKTAEAARRVCASCVVRRQCLDAHLDENVGIWGGTSERTRRTLRRNEGAA